MIKVSHKTSPVTLVLSGNHCEKLQLKIISAPQDPLVLGYPWLKLHNPHNPGQDYWLEYPLSFCLSAVCIVPLCSVPLSPTQIPPDFTLIPPKYHDLREAFSKSKALSLQCLLKDSYHHTIDLLLGAPLQLVIKSITATEGGYGEIHLSPWQLE